MKEIFKSYWYVPVILVCFVLMYFVYNMSSNDEIGVVSEYEEKEVVVEVKEKEDVVEVEENISYFVDIKGEVKKPGVYKIDSDKRIIDVINEAGGLTKNADTSLINLSKKVFDEMNIKIYSKTEVKNAKDSIKKEPEVIEIIKEIEKECVCPVVDNVCDNKNDAVINEENVTDINKEELIENKKDESSNNKKDEENKLVNLNTATKEELMSISGIGESKANSIIEYRNKNKFNKIEDILNVSGIGESVFEKIKQYIKV